MRDPKLTFLIRCTYGAVWLALIWLMVRYVLVWLLPFLIALALAALLEPAVVLCRRRLHLRRGFTATVLSLVVLGTVAAGLVLLAMVLLRQVCELSGRLPGYLEALPRWTELVRGAAAGGAVLRYHAAGGAVHRRKLSPYPGVPPAAAAGGQAAAGQGRQGGPAGHLGKVVQGPVHPAGGHLL